MTKILPIHRQNANDCEYLINYFLGDQDILNRTGVYTNNINNTVVVNYAYPITREVVGYTFGNGLEFVQTDMKYKDDVTKLSEIYSYEDNDYANTCASLYASVCGFGYLITLPSSEITKDMTPKIPIVHTYLDSRNTFIAYNTEVGNPTLISGYYIHNKLTGKYHYTCFTDKYRFEFDYGKPETLITTSNPIGKNPITMVENSLFLTGDWEQAISVMNALNQVSSDSLNDIEGTIKSLLVIIGAEFEDDTKIDKVKAKRILELSKGNGNNSNIDAKFIAPQLDSQSVENVRKYLEDAKNVITGIPDRQGNSSGGDTGMAVINRDGWTDIEIVARLKEMFFKKAKKRQLAVGIEILKRLGIIKSDITTLNINIEIGRHTYDNLQTKTQAFATLVATGELATIDCLELANLTNKTREIVERGEEAKKKREEDAIAMAKEAAKASGEGESSKNGANKTAEIEKAAANAKNKEKD